MKTRRTKPWMALAVLAIAAPILSGCTGASTVLGASWPGLEVVNNTIYLSFARVYAFNTDGTPRWSFPDQAHQLAANQAFFAPPAVDDKLIVVSDYADKVFGLDPSSGKQKWYFKSNSSRFIGGPVLSDKMVYAATADGMVHAIDRNAVTSTADGDAAKEVWSYSTDGSIWATPLLADGTLYITSMDRHLYALDAETGKLQWEYPDQTSAPENPPVGGIVGTPALHKGVLYFSSLNNHLYALDTATHKVLWSYESTNWVWGSPVVDDTTGYVVAADLDGHIFAIDPTSSDPKKPVWTVTVVNNNVPGARPTVVGSPVLRMMDDKTPVVYVTSDGDPNLYVLKVKDGSNALPPKSVMYTSPTMFLFIQTGTNTLPAKLYPSPAFIDDTLVVATHEGADNLFALDSKTLETKWPAVALKDVDTKLQATNGQPVDTSAGGLFGNPLNTLLLITAVFLLVSLVLRPPQGAKK